jgi:hypothetical protein
LTDDGGMNFGSRLSEKSAALAFTERTSPDAANPPDDWLQRSTARFRAAITLQIPVGFQDEKGFHSGEPAVMRNYGSYGFGE